MNYEALISPRAAQMRPSGIRKFFDIAAEMKDCISLGVGEPDFKTPWPIRDAGIRSLERGRTFYTSNSGLKELREEICTYLNRRFGLAYTAPETLVTVGGSEAIDLCVRALVQPGDEVIIPEPCFVCYEPITTLTGGVPVPLALKAENAELQKKILAMEEDVRTAEQYQRENEQLKTLLGLSEEHEDYSFVSAYIISWDSSDYKSAFTIGKGTNSGLEEGMCAVTENGQVVGLITKVGVNWATITTIMDSSLEISASIASSGYTGVVQGTYLPDGSSILRMNYLLTDAIIKNDDQVVTTGSTLYPRGLLLGYITNASQDETGVAKYATLNPSCDLDNLEQIFIITEYANN